MKTRTAVRETKRERIEARVTPNQKKRIERAAGIRGTSVSDFVVLSAAEAAARTIREQEILSLSERDAEVFVQALLNPPSPSKRLLAAARRYKERIKA